MPLIEFFHFPDMLFSTTELRSDSRGRLFPRVSYPAAAMVSRASVSATRIAGWASVFNVRATVAT